MRLTFTFAFALAALSGTVTVAAAQPSLMEISIPNTDGDSFVTGVSADGSTLIGWYEPDDGNGESAIGFRWTLNDGLNVFESLGGPWTNPSGINADGTVIIGGSAVEPGNIFSGTGFQWTLSGGMQLHPDHPGVFATVLGDASRAVVSANGSVQYASLGGVAPALRWTATGDVQLLPDYRTPPLGISFVRAATPDGSVAVGSAYDVVLDTIRPAMWNADGTLQELSIPDGIQLQGAGWRSEAKAISQDAQSVLGLIVTNANAQHAVLWTNDGGVFDLGVVGGFVRASILDGDVGVMVGESAGVAMLHTMSVHEGGVSFDLNDYLPTLGIDLSGWVLVGAHGISADGSLIYGHGRFHGQERWWVATGVPSPGVGTVLVCAGLISNRRRRSACERNSAR